MKPTPELKEAIKFEAMRRLCDASFLDFFRCFWHTVVQDELVMNWHIRTICEELQDVGERIIARQEKEYDLIINVPPGESKSTVCTVLFPVWLWIRDPSLRILTGSYAGSLSTAHAVKSRDCLRSDLFQKLYGDRLQLRTDIDAKSFYANNKGGERQAISTGSAVTGSHGHIIIVDDPMNPKQAASAAELSNARRWFFETLPTRKVDKSIVPTILIMQRLAEDDPTGAWLEKGTKVRHICIPGEVTPDVKPADLLQHYIDGIMNPTRNSAKVLQELKRILGSRQYAAQVLQSPAPAEGNILKKQWFTKYNPKDIPGFDKLPVNFYADTAYTEKAHNDPSAILAYKEHEGNLYLIDCAVVRMQFPELCRFVQQFAERNGYSRRSRIYIEPKASGKSVAQQLKRTTKLNVVEDKPPKDSKIVRVTAVSPVIEAGRVFVPDAPWVEEFLQECAMFPAAKHDDRVDCLVGAIKNSIFRKKGISTFIST